MKELWQLFKSFIMYLDTIEYSIECEIVSHWVKRIVRRYNNYCECEWYKDECVMSESNGNPLKALHNKLFKREIKYTAFYTYNYVYDLSNIKVEIRDNKIIIYLHENSIVIKDL